MQYGFEESSKDTKLDVELVMVSCKHFQVMGVLKSKSPITTFEGVELDME